MVTGLRSERRGTREGASRLAYLIESLGKCEAASSLGRWPPLVCLASTLEGIKGFNLAMRVVPFLSPSSLAPFLEYLRRHQHVPCPLYCSVGNGRWWSVCNVWDDKLRRMPDARAGAADLVLLSSSCLRIPTRFHSLLPPFPSLSPADCQPSLVPLPLFPFPLRLRPSHRGPSGCPPARPSVCLAVCARQRAPFS